MPRRGHPAHLRPRSALRDADVTVISGFHTPMEKECLDLLLRGEQPIVICPARSIERMRLPTLWRGPLAADRLLILSPFAPVERRPTRALAERRNRLVAVLARRILVAHATAESRTERLCSELAQRGKPVYKLNFTENSHLMDQGVVAGTVNGLAKLVAG
jgi:predicted Rossmann fold nucleotide-binding protein DprA/Smf involved in DNA uptake